MSARIFTLIVSWIVLIPSFIAAAILDEGIREHRLDNGLIVLLVERHSSPTVAAYITFGVGAVDENSRRRGIAHMLEHMLFKGTTTLGTRDYAAERPLLEEIEAVGEKIDQLKRNPSADRNDLGALQAQLADLQNRHREWVVKDEFSRIYAEQGGVGFNAFTSKDQTSYLINLPANKLELWAAIESDRLKNAVFREFYTERDVVLEERRRVVDTSPGGKLYENLLATAFQVHPYRHPIIGWQSDIENFSPGLIREFFADYYAAANMIITLVGAFDSDEVMLLIERYFADLPAGIRVPPIVDREPQQQGERRVHVTFDAEPRMMVAFHKPTLPHPDDDAFDILSRILVQGRTSRLYQALVVDRRVAVDVGIFRAPGSRYNNLLVFSLIPRHGVTPAELEAALLEEIDRLLVEPISDADIEKARHQILMSLLRGMRTNSGLARMLSTYQVLGDWRYLADYEDRLNAVGNTDLTRIVRQYLHRDNRTTAILSRGGEQ